MCCVPGLRNGLSGQTFQAIRIFPCHCCHTKRTLPVSRKLVIFSCLAAHSPHKSPGRKLIGFTLVLHLLAARVLLACFLIWALSRSSLITSKLVAKLSSLRLVCSNWRRMVSSPTSTGIIASVHIPYCMVFLLWWTEVYNDMPTILPTALLATYAWLLPVFSSALLGSLCWRPLLDRSSGVFD